MKFDQFSIGTTFARGGEQWLCTDVGTRVVVAVALKVTVKADAGKDVELTPENDPERFRGPPYRIPERVFSENDLEACTLVLAAKPAQRIRSEPEGDSVVLKIVDSCTSGWVETLSLFAVPPLRPGGKSADALQTNRDRFIVAMLVVAAVALYAIGEPLSLHVATVIVAFGVYREIDLTINFVRTGIFMSFRGDLLLSKEPVWRLRRIIVGVLFNYAELVLWFACVYYYFRADFERAIALRHEAFFFSASIMNTLGFSAFVPQRPLIVGFVYWQSFLTIFMIAVVIGTLVSIVAGGGQRQDQPASDGGSPRSGRWDVPLVTTAVLLLLLSLLLGYAKTSQ